MIISHNGVCECGHLDEAHYFCEDCGASFCMAIDRENHTYEHCPNCEYLIRCDETVYPCNCESERDENTEYNAKYQYACGYHD